MQVSHFRWPGLFYIISMLYTSPTRETGNSARTPFLTSAQEIAFYISLLKRTPPLNRRLPPSLSPCYFVFLFISAHLTVTAEMKPSQILALTATPLVLIAAPFASPQAPQASSPPAPGFTIGRELTSSDLEKCRLPDGAMNQTCTTILRHSFNDLEGQLQALQEMHELDDVSDEEYSTLVAELEDPEMVRTDTKTTGSISAI